MKHVASTHETAEKVFKRLKERKPIAYLRNGDGEILFMADKIKKGGFHDNSLSSVSCAITIKGNMENKNETL